MTWQEAIKQSKYGGAIRFDKTRKYILILNDNGELKCNSSLLAGNLLGFKEVPQEKWVGYTNWQSIEMVWDKE